MAIKDQPFDSENELEKWVYANLETFLGPCVLLRKFLISTSAGKGAIPDGIAFSFTSKQWYVVECELLKHGVWPHIAEQISRFAVALQNPDTLRRIRDELFEDLLRSGRAGAAIATLSRRGNPLASPNGRSMNWRNRSTNRAARHSTKSGDLSALNEPTHSVANHRHRPGRGSALIAQRFNAGSSIAKNP